jgi:hypothetical protein
MTLAPKKLKGERPFPDWGTGVLICWGYAKYSEESDP